MDESVRSEGAGETNEPVTATNRWDRLPAAFLAGYMMEEVEHPALNVQSVLMRGFLDDLIWPGEDEALIADELLFSALASHALMAQRESWFHRLAECLRDGDWENELVPAFMRAVFSGAHPVPFDPQALLRALGRGLDGGFHDFAGPFEEMWRDRLSTREGARPSVLEIACGSATEYRQLVRHGFAAHLDYTGVDLSQKNVANARELTGMDIFHVADAAALPFADGQFDVVTAFDLYEHLSPEAMERALAETARVCRGELFLSFFNAGWAPEHEIVPHEDYFWNRLSLEQLGGSLERHGFIAEVVDIPTEWPQRFPGYRHYNDGAHVIMARRHGL